MTAGLLARAGKPGDVARNETRFASNGFVRLVGALRRVPLNVSCLNRNFLDRRCVGVSTVNGVSENGTDRNETKDQDRARLT